MELQTHFDKPDDEVLLSAEDDQTHKSEIAAVNSSSAACELGVVACVGLVFVTKIIPLKLFIGGLAVGLGSYIASLMHAGTLKSTLQAQGMRSPMFHSRRFWQPTSFGIFGVIVLAIFGMLSPAHRMPYMSAHLFLSLLVYPLYGWAQEWLVQGFLTRNLAALLAPKSLPPKDRFTRQIMVCVISGVGFSFVHYPDKLTLGAVAIIGVVFSGFYQRDGDIFPLGLWHGWMGTIFYYWAKGEDPLGQLLK